MSDTKKALLITGLLWAAFIAIIMAVRPALPTSETRTLTVAWEMLARRDWLYMTLNFAPYSHKPPLLPWLINIAWMLFGVSKAAATLAPGIITLFVGGLTAKLGATLWPQKDKIPPTSIWIFFGFPLVLMYGSLALYDFLLAVFVLTGLLALINTTQKKPHKYSWVFLALSIGFGGLAKGPVILLHIVPVALLAHFWAPNKTNARWYGKFFLSILGGIAVTMLWAIPAAIYGGPEYARMIFWGQSAGRIVQAFDHAEPWWFFIALIPVYLLPWLFMLRPKKSDWKNFTWQTKFLLCWMIPVFIVFSIISGKQIHYLFPLYPAICVLFAAHIPNNRANLVARIPLALYYCLGLFLMVVGPFTAHATEGPAKWFAHLPPGYGMVIIGAVIMLLVWAKSDIQRLITATTLAGFIALGVTHLAATHGAFHAFDLSIYAKLVKAEEHEDNPEPIAYVGTYEGEFGFLARLEGPLTVIRRGDIPKWHKANPTGELIACMKPQEKQKWIGNWHPEKEETFRTRRFCGVYEPPRK